MAFSLPPESRSPSTGFPTLLCGADETQLNLIDGGQTSRVKPSLPFTLTSPAGLTGQLRALHILPRK
jgi:hypothetical protein